jgi:hypothetical protein
MGIVPSPLEKMLVVTNTPLDLLDRLEHQSVLVYDPVDTLSLFPP